MTTPHPDEQAREWLSNWTRYENTLESLAALLARVRLAEAEWWEHLSPDCDLPENQPCGYCERIASLRQARGERTKP